MKTVAVYGITSGSGKTSVAKELAGHFHVNGDKTILVDADLVQGKITGFLQLKKEPHIGFWFKDIFKRLETSPCWKTTFEAPNFEDYTQVHSSGLNILASNTDSSLCHSPLLLNGIDVIFRSFQNSNYDIAVWDTNNSIRDYTLDILFRADKVLLVADPFQLNLRNAETLIHLLRDEGCNLDQFGLVWNRFPTMAGENPEKISQILGISLYGVLPNFPDLTAKKGAGRIFTSSHTNRFTEEISRIASKI